MVSKNCDPALILLADHMSQNKKPKKTQQIDTELLLDLIRGLEDIKVGRIRRVK